MINATKVTGTVRSRRSPTRHTLIGCTDSLLNSLNVFGSCMTKAEGVRLLDSDLGWINAKSCACWIKHRYIADCHFANVRRNFFRLSIASHLLLEFFRCLLLCLLLLPFFFVAD